VLFCNFMTFPGAAFEFELGEPVALGVCVATEKEEPAAWASGTCRAHSVVSTKQVRLLI